MSKQELWLGVQQRLRAAVSPKEFETWFTPLALRQEDSRVVLTVPNHFFAAWIGERYRSILDQAVAQTLGQPQTLAFEVAEAEDTPTQVKVEPAPPSIRLSSLNQRYTFSTFVVGPCNELAYAACQAVAEQPGKLYNPLLVYGGAGLGKTHLLTAVGNRIVAENPAAKVHYCSAEGFTNELLQAVRFDGIASFQEKYRQVDCLLIDDIQFLAGRERTQEEFFHTFNVLYNAGRQIILSSDKMPKDIPGLEKRLRTRFEWGLMADLQPPDEETKVVILQKKAAERGLELSRKVATFLAHQPESNVRVLEGYLTRVIAISSFQGVEVTLELVKRVVGPLVSERQVGLEDVLSAVASHFGIKVSDLKGSRKNREVSQPRQVAMYLARRLTRHSFPEIGRAFGGKDHSTVVKGVKKIEAILRESPELAERVRLVERSLTEPVSLGGSGLGDGGI